MKKIIATSIGLYLFFISWTSAFAIDPRLPVHVIALVTLTFLFSLHIITKRSKVITDVLRWEDSLAILIVVSVTISSLANPTSTSINYVAAYFYVFVVGYILLKVLIRTYIYVYTAKTWLLLGVLLSAFISVLEFFFQYAFDINLHSYLNKIREIDVWVGGLYPRSASVATEPGVFAFFMVTVGVMSAKTLLSRNYSNTVVYLCLGIMFLGWAFTFSAAAIAASVFGFLAAITVKLLDSNYIIVRVLPVYLLPAAVVVMLLFVDYLDGTAIGQVVSKISLDQSSGSASVRVSAWGEALEVMGSNLLFGVGPGTAAAAGEHSYLSWYLFLGAEGGLTALIPALLFMVAKLSRVITSSIPNKYFYVAGFLAGGVHLGVISTFFHPFLWVLIIFFDIEQTQYRRCQILEKEK